MLIGLVGNKRVGKDSFAQYLVKKYNYKQVAFADPIKEACKVIFDFNLDQINGELKEVIDKRWGITPRQAFQIIGTEVFREILPEKIKELNYLKDIFWIKRFEIWYEKNKNKNIIISDCRFINETNKIKELGGILIKIDRNGLEKNDKHISEQLVDKIYCDYDIKNNGTIQEYYKNIDDFMSSII